MFRERTASWWLLVLVVGVTFALLLAVGLWGHNIHHGQHDFHIHAVLACHAGEEIPHNNFVHHSTSHDHLIDAHARVG